MPVSQQIMLWTLAVIAPVILNLSIRRGSDALGLSAMLLLAWCLGRITGALYSPPESMALYPIVDALSGAIAFVAWRTRPAWWKLALVGLFVTQSTLHAAFWLAWPQGASLYHYVLVNNVLFIGELITVSVPGGAYVLGRTLGYLSDRARGVHHARARRG